MSKLLSCVQDMFDIIDSYEYREQLLMPKLVITAANDEFFLPTDSRYWWADMLYCTVLYCTVLYCTVLYCTVLYCTVLYRWGWRCTGTRPRTSRR